MASRRCTRNRDQEVAPSVRYRGASRGWTSTGFVRAPVFLTRHGSTRFAPLTYPNHAALMRLRTNTKRLSNAEPTSPKRGPQGLRVIAGLHRLRHRVRIEFVGDHRPPGHHHRRMHCGRNHARKQRARRCIGRGAAIADNCGSGGDLLELRRALQINAPQLASEA
jgi:hypothetical protein